MFTSSVHRCTALFAGAAVTAAVLTGCAEETARTSAEPSTSATATESVETSRSTETPKPTGAPVGTATMEVRGGTGPVTIRYSINGGAEQAETAETLPWTKDYPVYDRLTSYVIVEGTPVCAIIMDGTKLVDLGTDDNATCSFAYWG